MGAREFYKYNENDILEILIEYLAQKSGYGTFSSRAILLGTPGEDLRLVAVVGALEDKEIDSIDFEELDKTIIYNGTHNSTYYSAPDELSKSLAEAITKRDF